jgi:hypothetical protein
MRIYVKLKVCQYPQTSVAGEPTSMYSNKLLLKIKTNLQSVHSRDSKANLRILKLRITKIFYACTKEGLFPPGYKVLNVFINRSAVDKNGCEL